MSQSFFFIGFVSLALPIVAVLEIVPKSKIYEGDKLDIFCSAKSILHSSESIYLYLSQGNQLLSSGSHTVNHSMVALAKDPGEFECRLEMGKVVKFDTKAVSVTGEWTGKRPVCKLQPAYKYV